MLDQSTGGGLVRAAPARVNIDDLRDFYERLRNLIGDGSLRTSPLDGAFNPVAHDTIEAALALAPYDREVINLSFGEIPDSYQQYVVSVGISSNEALAATVANVAISSNQTAQPVLVELLHSLVSGSRRITPGRRWLGLLRLVLPVAGIVGYAYLSLMAFKSLPQLIFAGAVGLLGLVAYREVDRALRRRGDAWCKRHDRIRIEVVSRSEQQESALIGELTSKRAW